MLRTDNHKNGYVPGLSTPDKNKCDLTPTSGEVQFASSLMPSEDNKVTNVTENRLESPISQTPDDNKVQQNEVMSDYEVISEVNLPTSKETNTNKEESQNGDAPNSPGEVRLHITENPLNKPPQEEPSSKEWVRTEPVQTTSPQGCKTTSLEKCLFLITIILAGALAGIITLYIMRPKIPAGK